MLFKVQDYYCFKSNALFVCKREIFIKIEKSCKLLSCGLFCQISQCNSPLYSNYARNYYCDNQHITVIMKIFYVAFKISELLGYWSSAADT